MHQLPQTGYLRLTQILGNKKSNPPTPPIIPIGKSSWWEGVRTGRYPQPMKLGPKITVWRVEDILTLVQEGCYRPSNELSKKRAQGGKNHDI